jgi:ABC-type polysaccharide/polyol phosphate transport system ATPase subunit
MSLPTASNSEPDSPEQNHNLAVRLENVSVRYRVPMERIGTFKEYAIRKMQRRITYKNFLAVHNISADIYEGEVFGIIGRNGAGKSTLLKLIARVLRPTEGRVWVKGLVAPLLEVSAGLHPELTGRENIFLNGTLLGFSYKQMSQKLDRIVEFAELQEFIDAPVRTYSQGMVGRLGFAIATDVQPDVLIVDEVLAVGDEEFRKRCVARMEDFRKQGATILYVTHSMGDVEYLCDRVLWIDHGEAKALGNAREVLKVYRESQHT